MTWWESFKIRPYSHIPSALSFLRVGLGIALPFLILSPSPLLQRLSVGLFLIGVLTDYFDGWLARKYNFVTDSGKILDPTADKILILSPLVAFSFLGYYSLWWIVPIFVREVLVSFCRIGWLLEGRAVGAEKLGKLKFGFQVSTVLVLFAHFLLQGRVDGGSGERIFNGATLLCLFFSNFFTLVSGASFVYSNRRHFQTQHFATYVSACGVGLIPVVPGTWGSLLGVVIFLATGWNLWLYALAALFIFLAAAWSIPKLDLSKLGDPQFVVIDEVLGMLVALFSIPPEPVLIGIGFVLFRFFDIFKPFPLRRLERLPGHWGILADDVGAGLYVRLILQYFL